MEINKLPQILSPIIKMDYPNESIAFHRDKFVIKWENNDYNVVGDLLLEWSPSIAIVFRGKYEMDLEGIDFKSFGSSISIEISNDNINFHSKGVLKKVNKNYQSIECWLSSPVTIGNIDEPIEYIKFELANQEQRLGDLVKTSENSAFPNRLQLIDTMYNIAIDHYSDNYLKSLSNLHENKGFQLISTGRIDDKTSKRFKFNEINTTIAKLSAFLQFLNARKSPPLIIYGFSDDKIRWKLIRTLENDPYENYKGWVPKHEEINLNKIWDKFCEIWSNSNDQESLELTLHWYNEANKSNISLEGRIVLIQNALELMFNWLISEKYEYVSQSETNNMSASSKIGFLLSYFHIDSKIPIELIELKKYAAAYNFINAPETFVNIRNSIVHSNLKKRKRLETLTKEAKNETLTLGIWFVEVVILKLLDYKGVYINRCKNIKSYESKDVM